MCIIYGKGAKQGAKGEGLIYLFSSGCAEFHASRVGIITWDARRVKLSAATLKKIYKPPLSAPCSRSPSVDYTRAVDIVFCIIMYLDTCNNILLF